MDTNSAGFGFVCVRGTIVKPKSDETAVPWSTDEMCVDDPLSLISKDFIGGVVIVEVGLKNCAIVDVMFAIKRWFVVIKFIFFTKHMVSKSFSIIEVTFSMIKALLGNILRLFYNFIFYKNIRPVHSSNFVVMKCRSV